MRKITFEKKYFEGVVKKYKTKKKIAEKLNISVDTVRKISRELDVDIPRVNWKKGLSYIRDYKFVDKKWLIEHWVNSSKSLYEVAEEFKVPLSTLSSRVALYNINKKYKYHIDTEKIENINDPHIFYLAGLLATDGYIPLGMDTAEIQLTGEDEKNLLLDIKSYFNITNDIYQYGKCYRLRFRYEGLNNFLIKNFNIINGPKTYCINVPDMFPNESCAKAYVLGCIDGDGYIGKNCFSLLSKSIEFIDGIISIYTKYTNVNLKRHFSTINGSTYPCVSATDKKCKDFLKWIYSDCNLYFKLNRKFLSYKKMMI